MDVVGLIERARSAGVQLWVADGRLRFRAPTGAFDPSLRDALSRNRAEIMSVLSVPSLSAFASDTLAAPGPRSDNGATMSSAQERLWFLDRLAEGRGVVYNVPAAWRIVGPVSVARLERAFRATVRRHDVLRTVYPRTDGEPQSVVDDSVSFTLGQHDLRGPRHGPPRTADEIERLAAEHVRAEAARVLDIATGPVLAGRVLTLADDDHVLAIVIHHIACDGWSLTVLMGDVSDAYRLDADLSPLPLQYADYARWQRSWLETTAGQAQLERRVASLQAAPAALDLPSDRPRPSALTVHGAARHFRFPASVIEGLHRVGERERCTPFVTVLATFAVLLRRLADQSDLVIGIPTANRERPEVEDLVGVFVNMLAVRVTIVDDPTFTNLLAQVRDVFLDAYADQACPFEQVVERLQPERSLSRAPIFQVALDYHTTPPTVLDLAGCRVTSLPADTDTAKYDLLLELADTGDGLVGLWQYSTDLFDEPTIRGFEDALGVLMEAIASDPDRPLSELPLLTPGEEHSVLDPLDRTDAVPFEDSCVHDLFAARVRLAPDAIALVTSEEQVSYAELDRRAEELADLLRARGVGPEVRVGVALARRAPLVAALLGVLKAGGAYVPIDPAYPLERIAYMVEDSAAHIVVTDWASRARVEATGVSILCLDGDEPEPSDDGAGRPVLRTVGKVRPTNVAYVIYTSGSTGQPKGVAIEHRNAVSRLRWAADELSLESLGGLLASTSVCFDLSVYEIFGPLASGGCVILADGILELPSHPARHRVRLINTVPTAMAELVRSTGVPAHVRRVNLAGEPLSEALVRQIYETTRVEDVRDLYGPSEDTT